MKGPLQIYTDGACIGNPGAGGWGVFIIDQDKAEYEFSGFEAHTTNNRMELMGAIRALDSLKDTISVSIYTDSQYLKKGITLWIHAWIDNGWKTTNKQSVKNQDLWMELHHLTQKHDVCWNWIKGHAGHFGNERADALARNAIVQLRM